MDTPDEHSLDQATARIIRGYLAALESHLPISRRARTRIGLEIADGLACAVTDRVERGESSTAAAQAAIGESGDPRIVAAAFANQLARAGAHRIGIGLVVTGPIVGALWVTTYAHGGGDWQSDIVGLLSAIPLYPLILAIVVPAAMIAIAGAGWAARQVVVPSRLVTAAASVAAIGCVAGDLTLLSAAIVGPAANAAALIALAMTASVVRLSVAGWAGYRIGRLRAVAH